jgi:hypothetical protein
LATTAHRGGAKKSVRRATWPLYISRSPELCGLRNETGESVMTAKLRIKAKGIEIEWEGEVDYLKNDLPDLIAAMR